MALEPFVRVNHNAYLHGAGAFGGKPQRYRTIQADFHGTIADMLAKAIHGNKLTDTVTAEDTEILLAALRNWGALDRQGIAESSYRRLLWEGFPGHGESL